MTAAVPLVLVDAAYASGDVLTLEPTFERIAAAVLLYAIGTAAFSAVFTVAAALAHALREGGQAPSSYTLERAWTAAVTGTVVWAAVVAGLIAFVVPGLLLLTRWSLALQVVAIEARTWRRALARSSELVRGRGWLVFAWALGSTVAYLAAYYGLYAALGALPQWPRSWVSGYAVDVAALPVLAVAWTVLYRRLAESAAPTATTAH